MGTNTELELANVRHRIDEQKTEMKHMADRIATIEAENQSLRITVSTAELTLKDAMEKTTVSSARAEKAEAEVKRLEEVQALTYRRAQHLDDRASRAEALVRELVEALDTLLAHVNGVTAFYRHGNNVPNKKLLALSNWQVKIEEQVERAKEAGL